MLPHITYRYTGDTTAWHTTELVSLLGLKNRHGHGHWLCWMSTGRKSALMLRTHTHPGIHTVPHYPSCLPKYAWYYNCVRVRHTWYQVPGKCAQSVPEVLVHRYGSTVLRVAGARYWVRRLWCFIFVFECVCSVHQEIFHIYFQL